MNIEDIIKNSFASCKSVCGVIREVIDTNTTLCKYFYEYMITPSRLEELEIIVLKCAIERIEEIKKGQ